MVRNHNLAKRVITAQDHVTSLLALEIKASLRQGIHTISARNLGQFAHTASNNASKRSFGTGKLTSSKAAIYAWLAS
jgi:hypothetical protein